MLSLKFTAGLATILIFMAYYCFKAAVHKSSNNHGSSTGKEKKKAWLLFVTGSIFTALGIVTFILLLRQL